MHVVWTFCQGLAQQLCTEDLPEGPSLRPWNGWQAAMGAAEIPAFALVILSTSRRSSQSAKTRYKTWQLKTKTRCDRSRETIIGDGDEF